jgi:hypothetical protein
VCAGSPVELAGDRSSRGDTLDLLKASIEAGAVIVGISPYTNRALLDGRTPLAARPYYTSSYATAVHLLPGGFGSPHPAGEHREQLDGNIGIVVQQRPKVKDRDHQGQRVFLRHHGG